MSFEQYETSRTKGHPITLYQFNNVDGEQYLYTDAEAAVTHPDFSSPFTPQPIQHGAIRSSGTLDKVDLEIRMPRTVPLSEHFRVYPPGEVVSIIVRQFHKTDSAAEALVVWSGRLVSASWQGEEIVFLCEPVSTSLRRTGLRRHYQIGCPHVLYGTQCAASKAAATTPLISVVSVSGTTVVLPVNWLPSEWPAEKRVPSKFVGGMMTWENPTSDGGTTLIKRTILRVNGTSNIVLAGPPTGLKPGGNIQMVLGCNHQMSDCLNVHANIKNYGGQPWIPTKTPFGFSNQYY